VLYSLPGNLSGTLEIRNLRVSCIIGDLPEERHNSQTLIYDIFLDLDLSAVVRSDRLKDTVDYVAVATLVQKIAQEGQFHMIEALAAHTAYHIRAAFPQIQKVRLIVFKPGIIHQADGASIEISM